MDDAVTSQWITLEEHVDSEQVAWIRMTPQERWRASRSLLQHFLSMGGSLEPDPDPQSPFWSREDIQAFAQSAIAHLPPRRSQGAGS